MPEPLRRLRTTTLGADTRSVFVLRVDSQPNLIVALDQFAVRQTTQRSTEVIHYGFAVLVALETEVHVDRHESNPSAHAVLGAI